MENPFQKNKHACPQLVEYDCGCIGFPPSGDDSIALLVYWCDSSSYEESPYELGFRPMTRPDANKGFRPKDYKALEPEHNASTFNQLSELIDQGHGANHLKQSLARLLSDVFAKPVLEDEEA